MKLKRLVRKTAIVGASLMIASACGKKSKSSTDAVSDGSIAPTEDALVTLATGALQLAGEVAILKGKDASTTLALGSKEVSFKLLEDHPVRLRVTNEAFEDLEKAGSIMCFLSQTKFWEQANNGVYQAQVDSKKCEPDKGGGNGDDSSGGEDESPDLQVAYIKSVREENKPLIAEIRIAAGGDKEEAYYHVKVIVVEPPSSTAPAGIFDMHYTAHMGSKVGETGFIRTKRTSADKFVLETGSSGSEGGGNEGKSQGIAELQVEDEVTVAGFLQSDSAGNWGEQKYSSKGIARFADNYLNVNFTSTHSGPQGENKEELKGCYDLGKYKTAMFRYDLVDTATGVTKKLNSGFPIEFDKDGKTQRGWAGFHGVWLGESGSVKTGDTIKKVSWTGGKKSTSDYTVFAAPGKLTKLTKASVTLGDLKGVDLNLYDMGSQYIVKWDGTTLSKTAKVTNGKNGPEEEAATGAVTIPQWGINFYVSSLNAMIRISKEDVLSNSLAISYFAEKVVSGTAEVPSCEMVCFQNCPVMAPAASDFARSQGGMNGPMVSGLYKKTSVSWGGGAASDSNQSQNISTPLATYTWDASTQNLKEGSTAFALPSGLSSSSQDLQMINSGSLVCAADYAAISGNKASIDPYRMQNGLTSFYRFNAGANDWNKFISLKDSTGTFVSFDQPLELSYTHTTANDWDANTDTSFIGKSFRLQYEGPGNLHGIPWKYAKEIGHQMPLFSIKSGVTVGAYTIYPINGEQRLAKAADEASCAAIPLEDAPALPELDGVAIDVGDLGDSSSVLRYIGGVAVE